MMDNRRKTKQQLLHELVEMDRRITELEESRRGYEKIVQALRESENKFRDLAEKSIVGIYLIQDWEFKYVNPKFAEIFGYPVNGLVTGTRPEDVVLPEDWHMVKENIRKRIAGEAESIYSEFRIITKNREIRNVEVYGSRTMLQGKSALIGTLLDITERKRSEKLLKEAEQKYRSIFENAVEGIFQTTPEGQIIAANPAQAKILGYDSPKKLIESLTDIGHQIYVEPELRLEFISALERDGVLFGFEPELYKKDGSKIWVSMNARNVRDTDDKSLYYEGTIVDITEKKKAENDLRILNEFNKAIIDNAPVAVFTLNKDGMFTSINPALASLSGLGLKAEEKLIGFNWLRNQYTIQCGLSRHIEGGLRGEPFQLSNFPFINYRGDRNIFIDFQGVPLKGENGEIEGLLCIIEETTDRVKTQAKLMQEAKMSAIGKLAASIAHELNNPLGTMVAYSELAGNCFTSLRGPSTKQSELQKLKGYLKVIEEEAFRCKNVTTDILRLFQKEGLEITRIDVNQLLSTILELMNTDKSNIRFIMEVSSPLPFIMGDRNALRQVFVNIIHNAMDATEGRTNATIWLRTKLANNLVVVEIDDNGTGIPVSIIDRIFEPFFTTKEPKKGTGLGLFLCYDLVNDMGGTVKAKSKPGYRTTFTISFPALKI
jgi:PAS domain S-box-containing protein